MSNNSSYPAFGRELRMIRQCALDIVERCDRLANWHLVAFADSSTQPSDGSESGNDRMEAHDELGVEGHTAHDDGVSGRREELRDLCDAPGSEGTVWCEEQQGIADAHFHSKAKARAAYKRGAKRRRRRVVKRKRGR